MLAALRHLLAHVQLIVQFIAHFRYGYLDQRELIVTVHWQNLPNYPGIFRWSIHRPILKYIEKEKVSEPRIDPLQLLKCLSVLLSPTGGIKSKEEVQRLASLMTKFSKKLVSKCIYIQILKTTKTDLLGMFMTAGGWNLTNTWLSDAIVAKNWPLIQELLELLLMCPVDVERLKINNCPKLIKGLSKDSSNESVKLLASKLVEQWLKIVKGETEAVRAQHGLPPASTSEVRTSPAPPPPPPPSSPPVVKEEPPDSKEEVKQETIVTTVKLENLETKVEIQKLVIKPEDIVEGVANTNENFDAPLGQLPVYKITFKDGKRVLAKVLSGEKLPTPKDDAAITDNSDFSEKASSSVVTKPSEIVKREEGNKEGVEDVPVVKVNTELQKPTQVKVGNSVDTQKPVKGSVKKTKDSSGKKSSGKDKVRDKERSKDKSRESKSRDREKVKDRKSNSDKDNGISEKDKATLAKLIPPAISKLGKIPKKPKTDEVAKPAAASEAKKSAVSEVRKPAPAPEPVVTKKPSISIESRKLGDPGNRPKTVKTFNSKFRSTGLEEEAKPPPSRQGKKAAPAPLPAKLPSLKRPSPPKDMVAPPEKKMKPAVVDSLADDAKKEKSGGIKLIPPRPKPSFLQESDMFMDALTASTKKEPRKRKRRVSSSKDGPEAKKDSPATVKEEENKVASPPPPTSPQNNVKPPLLKFYQDTLETNGDEKEETSTAKESEKTDENQDSTEIKIKMEEDIEKPPTPTEDEMEDKLPTEGSEEQKRRSSDEDGPKDEESSSSKDNTSEEGPSKSPRGVLIYHKARKGPKKVVRWKQEKELETIRYFELDETERVNVTKNFTDMKQMERSNEREGFLLARKIAQDDIMEEKTTWQPLIPIDLPPSLVEFGQRSQEKEVQYAREKVILQAIYFTRSMIPDSPAEPDMEIHPTISAVMIPLEDVTGNQDSVNDFQNTPWPEPKPILIPQSPPPQFQQPQPPFNQFQNPGFQGGGPPMFQNQGGMPNNMPMPPPMVNNVPMNNMPSGGGDWRTGDGKVLPVNDMPMDMYNQGGPPMGMGMPGMGGPDMNYSMMNDDMGPGGPYPGQGFPMGGPPPGMFPYRGGGGNNRDMRRGRGNNQMGPRGPSNAPWYQNAGPHSWQGRGSGGGGRGGRGGWGGPPQTKGICKHFRTGFCKHGEGCPYLHPGINGPLY